MSKVYKFKNGYQVTTQTVYNGGAIMNSIENKQMIDDELEDMERYYGLLDDDYDEMRENGVSWSDFI
jgi:hypothetical protein